MRPGLGWSVAFWAVLAGLLMVPPSLPTFRWLRVAFRAVAIVVVGLLAVVLWSERVSNYRIVLAAGSFAVWLAVLLAPRFWTAGRRLTERARRERVLRRAPGVATHAGAGGDGLAVGGARDRRRALLRAPVPQSRRARSAQRRVDLFLRGGQDPGNRRVADAALDRGRHAVPDEAAAEVLDCRRGHALRAAAAGRAGPAVVRRAVRRHRIRVRLLPGSAPGGIDLWRDGGIRLVHARSAALRAWPSQQQPGSAAVSLLLRRGLSLRPVGRGRPGEGLGPCRRRRAVLRARRHVQVRGRVLPPGGVPRGARLARGWVGASAFGLARLDRSRAPDGGAHFSVVHLSERPRRRGVLAGHSRRGGATRASRPGSTPATSSPGTTTLPGPGAN